MNTTITVVGPLTTKEAAEQTATALGRANHSVYSMALKDADGYDTDERAWYVERDTSAPSDTIFGYSWEAIQAKQQKR